ncbi:hypothetical protein ACE1CI_27460 [Aerosakkonemataceae cyanobacterium BLCC-F50]|uniref:Uncharacterized protein n=1 Tax=Floridaenema flaviceps BLCC-F50 TaxID=3153642 RepID=A0ABV4XYX5_9CYAN
MQTKVDSLRSAINTLKQHQDKLESKLRKTQFEKLLFNLEEINLDIERLASQLISFVEQNESEEELERIFASFQYGSIPHITGHLETIEELLEKE